MIQIIEIAFAYPENSVATAHPEIAEVVLENSVDLIVEQTLPRRIDSEFTVLKAVQPASLGSEPERMRLVFVDRVHHVMRESLRGRLVFKVAASPQAEPAIGAEPKLAIAGFVYCHHHITGETFCSVV